MLVDGERRGEGKLASNELALPGRSCPSGDNDGRWRSPRLETDLTHLAGAQDGLADPPIRGRDRRRVSSSRPPYHHHRLCLSISPSSSRCPSSHPLPRHDRSGVLCPLRHQLLQPSTLVSLVGLSLSTRPKA
ncbi:hypothetical protein VTN02DRAFT_526 [Thermoascus thermophilus]